MNLRPGTLWGLKQVVRNGHPVMVQQILNDPAQGVFIANPSPNNNTSGIGKSSIGQLNNFPIEKAPANHSGGNAAVEDRAYLEWGAARVKAGRNLQLYCAGFTSLTIALMVGKFNARTLGNLNAPGAALAANTLVEAISSGESSTGHIYAVVGRAPGSDLQNFTTWGQNCIVVDPWLALQTVVHGTQPRFVASIATRAAHDQHFFDTLDGYGNRVVKGTYNVLAYDYLSVVVV